MNFLDLIKKYPPRHTYIKDKYWYEKISDDEIKKQLELTIDDLDSVESETVPVLNNTDSDISQEESKIKLEIDENTQSIIAFNYLWPRYNLAFLKASIESVIPHVQKYILFLNKYSYIGEECLEGDLDYVRNIISKYEKVELRYNPSKDHPESVKKDNIGHYFKVAATFAKDNNIEYVWLVQTDEVYDDINCKNIINYLKDGKFKDKANVFVPNCYIDNPHWVVMPPENFKRPTIIDTNTLIESKFDYKNIQTTKHSDITFHHLSYVMKKDELVFKFKNWGHRKDIQNIEQILSTFDLNKINKHLTDLHPIHGPIYKSVRFVNNDINKKLFLEWINYLMEYKNPYDTHDFMFKDTVCDFPTTPEKQYPMTVEERKFLSAVITECIPTYSNMVEYGSWNGYNTLMMRLSAPNSWIFAIDNYDTPDKLYGQYSLMMKDVYNMACRKMFFYNVHNMNFFNGDAKFICQLRNSSIDFAYINSGIDPKRFTNVFIELWPKLKDGAIICGHYTINDQIKEAMSKLIGRNITVSCPWGHQNFDYYEIYTNVLEDVQKQTNKKFEQYGMLFIRVKKI